MKRIECASCWTEVVSVVFCLICRLLVFRVCTAAWMTRWLAANGKHMPRYVLTMGTVGLSLVSTMNVVLFYRLLRADILNNTHSTSRKH